MADQEGRAPITPVMWPVRMKKNDPETGKKEKRMAHPVDARELVASGEWEYDFPRNQAKPAALQPGAGGLPPGAPGSGTEGTGTGEDEPPKQE